MCMMNDITVAATSEETTAYALGHAIGTLLNLRRMVELNMEEYDLPRAKGTVTLFSKDEVMDKFDQAINKLNTIKYPYKI